MVLDLYVTAPAVLSRCRGSRRKVPTCLCFQKVLLCTCVRAPIPLSIFVCNNLMTRPITVKHLLPLLFLPLFFACHPESPEDILADVRAKTAMAQSISYELHEIWDNRFMGTADTSFSTVKLYRNEKPTWDYDYIRVADDYDSWLIGESSGLVLHDDKLTIKRTEEETVANFTGDLSNRGTISTSPEFLLSISGWTYKRDTTFAGRSTRMYTYRSYFKKADTVTYQTHEYLFINPKTKKVVGQQSVNWANERLNQVISYWYENYEENKLEPLKYITPMGYGQTTETAYDESREKGQITVGEAAPDFTATTLDGETFTLSDYSGQRVMLNFSFIGCGGCEMAMKDFNRPGFELADEMKGVYLSYMNKPKEIRTHYKNKGMPFIAIPEAREPDRLYGIRAYPTFVIIDEEGKVEQIEVGYSKEFIASIEKL